MDDPIPQELSWIGMMDSLDQGDITRDDKIWETNYIYCLQKLLLWKYRDEAYEQQRKQQEARNK